MAISDELRKQVDPNNECCCKHCLSNKCKEWAYSTYGIMIQSYPYCGKGRADAIKGLKVDEVFKEKTEPEAIFKATQWVLDNVKTTSIP